MKKHLKKYLMVFFNVLLLIFVQNLNFSIAKESATLTVQLTKINDFNLNNVSLEAWKIKESDDIEINKDYLYNLSSEELTNKFGKKIISNNTTSEGIVLFENIDYGTYYIRQSKETISEQEVVPFIVVVNKKFNVIDAKNFIPKNNGKRKFVKSSTTSLKLEGAVFKVLKNDNEVVKINSEDYTVTSSSNGEFVVEGLEYGDYYLKEVNAPKGYKLNEKLIPFSISINSEYDEPKVITNIPDNPPLIDIPYTGNAILLLTCSIGLLLFVLGVSLLKISNKK